MENRSMIRKQWMVKTATAVSDFISLTAGLNDLPLQSSFACQLQKNDHEVRYRAVT